jgi:ABC-type branched-subunit amino acid transport system substrate-binding protein
VYASHEETEPDELLSLSLKELLAIPIDRPYQGVGIFQSDHYQISKQSINIGLLVPLTSWPKYSTQLIAAADLATEHVNRNGGIVGRPLAVIRADTDNTINQSNRFAKQLVESYQSQLLIGPVASDEASRVLKEVNLEHQVPMISYAASANSLARFAGGKLFWRLLASNKQQVSELTRKIKQSKKYQRMVIIGTKDIYSLEMSDGIKKNFPEATIKELRFSSKIDPKIYNIEDDVTELVKFNPQSIVLLTKAALNNELLNRLFSQWKGTFPLVFSGDNLQIYDLPPKLTNNPNLCLLSVRPKNLGDEHFVKQLSSITASEIKDLNAAYVYDAIMLFSMAKTLQIKLNLSFSDALKRITGDGQPIDHLQYAQLESMVKQYKNLSYHGVSGQVKFDRWGNNLSAMLGVHRSGGGCLQKL